MTYTYQLIHIGAIVGIKSRKISTLVGRLLNTGDRTLAPETKCWMYIYTCANKTRHAHQTIETRYQG